MCLPCDANGDYECQEAHKGPDFDVTKEPFYFLNLLPPEMNDEDQTQQSSSHHPNGFRIPKNQSMKKKKKPADQYVHCPYDSVKIVSKDPERGCEMMGGIEWCGMNRVPKKARKNKPDEGNGAKPRQMCLDFTHKRYLGKGAGCTVYSCKFLHFDGDIPDKMCPVYYLSGACKFNHKCQYQHTEHIEYALPTVTKRMVDEDRKFAEAEAARQVGAWSVKTEAAQFRLAERKMQEGHIQSKWVNFVAGLKWADNNSDNQPIKCLN